MSVNRCVRRWWEWRHTFNSLNLDQHLIWNSKLWSHLHILTNHLSWMKKSTYSSAPSPRSQLLQEQELHSSITKEMKRSEGEKKCVYWTTKKAQNKPSTCITGLVLSCTGGNPLPLRFRMNFKLSEQRLCLKALETQLLSKNDFHCFSLLL